ncbi:transmembrane amino acid transporter protein-domain-containing protein [Aspergillus candidus]|uniref:Transmembrane amino acid transporter protein-domain-containing protein n=1 Tax=Aspergillus candidus TaxID=41067 RepID=A0A2I2FGW2_ASPCN|nr:transmembrane amino acid transporter protein-domain-containing protein [Aspergillus candidus]PLB39871.1 transmembrane amino acid transporter protein-domain-containing protein [Aspergillus candidus]
MTADITFKDVGREESAPRLDLEAWEPDMMEKQDLPPTAYDPFGSEETAEVHYKTLSWWQSGMLMIAETVSLGVLSIPATLASIGLVPGIILIVGLGIISTYSGYVIGQFRQRYPSIHSMADAADVMLGPWGREIFGVAQLIFFLFATASHILTFTVMMNTLTNHGTCSLVFGVVGLILSFLCSLPRTMKNVSTFAVVSFLSIFVSVVITMVGVGVEHPGDGQMEITKATSFVNAFTAVTNIVFAYCGHAAFFGFIAEMKDPRDFPKSLAMLQGFEIVFYTIAAAVIYRYAGQGVASPALGSTGPILQKVAYGIAIPTIVIAGVINGHVAIKNVYVRLFRGTDLMHQRSLRATGSWIALALTFWIISWIIAEAIPVFNNLLSLISALFASWFSFGLSGIFGLYMTWGQLFTSPKRILLTIANVLLIGIGTTICVCGLWVSGVAIHNDASKSSFSCANNA